MIFQLLGCVAGVAHPVALVSGSDVSSVAGRLKALSQDLGYRLTASLAFMQVIEFRPSQSSLGLPLSLRSSDDFGNVLGGHIIAKRLRSSLREGYYKVDSG
jgi:hypothetical protein